MVSGVVYTFAALLSVLVAIACVGFGIYLVSSTITTALTGNFERASYFLLQAIGMGVAAIAATMYSNHLAKHGLELMNVGVEEEEEEYMYLASDDDEEGDED